MTNRNEALRLADSIKARAIGWTEWRVESPDDGAYVMVFTSAESFYPEHDARTWLAEHTAKHPDSQFANYIVAKHHCFSQVEQDALDAAALLRQQAERIAGLEGEIANLHTTMFAAAVEIQEHWEAHCDAEGYGPANLMHRLERGIASQYGYDAKTLQRVEAERDQLKTDLHIATDDAAQMLASTQSLRSERDQLRAEVERLKPNAERWEYALNSEEFAVCEWGTVFGELCWVPISEESAIDHARTTHKDEG